jgi:hypothetical protein
MKAMCVCDGLQARGALQLQFLTQQLNLCKLKHDTSRLGQQRFVSCNWRRLEMNE